MSEQVTLASIEIGDRGLWGLRDKIEKLNKRAKRCNVEPITLRVVRQWTTKHPKSGCDVNHYQVEIEGVAPRINGWSIAAKIENNPTIGKIVRVVPGPFEDDDYSGYRDHDFSCDHCNTNRRRNDVFVLKNDDGFEKVIGRNCLADYLRVEDAEAFARFAEFCEQCSALTDAGCCDEEREFGGRGYRPNLGLESFLSVVQCCTRRLGWTSRSQAYDDPGATATADSAYYVIFGYGKHHEEFIERNELEVSDGDRDLAEKAVEWVSNLTPADTSRSEYLDVIRRIGQAGETDEKLSGYAASIIRAYQKDQEWKAEREEKAKNTKTKVHVGSPKERLKDLIVQVLRVRYYESNFGTKTIVAMELDNGDGTVSPLTWFASSSLEFEEGADYIFTGTVKEHKSDDRFGPQTVVSRCKLTEVA
jgi:hypothetical protein